MAKAKTQAKRAKKKVRAKSTAKAKPRSRTAAKSKSKPKSKAKAITRTKLKSKAKSTTKTKSKSASVKTRRPSLSTGSRPKLQPLVSSRSGPKGKALSRDFLIKLATAIRDVVQPLIHASKGREVVGNAASGDATFKLDEHAEKALLTYLRDIKAPVAYYSEDSGYTTFTSGQPKNLLVVDPIDGTRAAKCGLEGSVIAVASTRVIERPRLGDIENACIMETLGNRVFYAERGKGARIYQAGQYKKPRLSSNKDLEMMPWSMTVPARPAELIFPTAAKLIDLTSLKGGFFACNSTSFSLTRLLTGQLDACVDFANRYLRDLGKIVQDQFINAGRGSTIGIAPYDIAASLLVAEEAGCVVTDAYGESLNDVLVLDSSATNHCSMIAASNAKLHAKLMEFFDTRIQQYEKLLKRRANIVGK